MDGGARRRTAAKGAAAAGFAIALLLTLAPAAATQAAPGTPTVMGAPTPVLVEDFDNATPPSADFVQTIADYPSGVVPPTVPGYVGLNGVPYTADAAWNGEFCDGLIVNQAAPTTTPALAQTAACSDSAWTELRNLAGTLGKWHLDPSYPYASLVDPGADFMDNLALTSYTEGDAGPGVMAATSVPASVGHDYTASLDATQTDCWASDPAAVTIALTGTDGVGGVVFPGPIDTCATPVVQIGGEYVGTFYGSQNVRIGTPTMHIALANLQGGGGGNDSGYDNIVVLDVTAQLDQSYAAGPENGAWTAGDRAPLTMTVTNTHLPLDPLTPSGAKLGWSATDLLPSGLTVAAPLTFTTDCANGALTSTAPGTLTIGGDLGAADVSCTFTVDVTSDAGGTYTSPPAAFGLEGLLAPASASVTFVAAEPTPTPTPTPSPTADALAPTGASDVGALIGGAIALLLGGLVCIAGASRRRRA